MSAYRAVKGTRDIFPEEIAAWKHIENVIGGVAELYGFQEIRTPVFEYTDLFRRGIGAATDIVGKEMFSFEPDPGGRSITLRPEMTAGVMRAFLQKNLHAAAPVHKLYYIAELFRKERPQAGRQRQFAQFGAELLGASSPEAVAEVIGLMMQVFSTLGVKGLKLRINTLGDMDDRVRYRDALKAYLVQYAADLDEPSRERLEKNPLRILDSKNPAVQDIVADGPKLRDYLKQGALDDFEQVLRYLDERGVSCSVDPLLVRGLDYYCHTAFEVASPELGAQDALGGGGRYDGLARQLGSKTDIPAAGFAVGMERLLIVMEKQGLLRHIGEKGPRVYVVLQDRELVSRAVTLCNSLRSAGISAEMDLCARSMKAQMREANRMHADFALFVGEAEIRSGLFGLKNLRTSGQEELDMKAVIARLCRKPDETESSAPC
ncbi:histidine--tRNA ligase [Prosthecochloris sp. GSB1]|uniref:histidine--tRNA ligase n=1 Tax=Prosthecochloris sp. GSB1 TaxID=281093 RepID=UPI000B8C93C8|nr:histidine--tRNA ligase [Prosthecochloris sp. GSB1]ASQ89858.1 histidine--tRNA ligase [Prosthecochloris sp. GSB1]